MPFSEDPEPCKSITILSASGASTESPSIIIHATDMLNVHEHNSATPDPNVPDPHGPWIGDLNKSDV